MLADGTAWVQLGGDLSTEEHGHLRRPQRAAQAGSGIGVVAFAGPTSLFSAASLAQSWDKRPPARTRRTGPTAAL